MLPVHRETGFFTLQPRQRFTRTSLLTCKGPVCPKRRATLSRSLLKNRLGKIPSSAQKLDATLLRGFQEKQIYRIDHYLAKETVQNILMFRFANSIFEPLWNRRYIDHIQITASETLGIEQRAGYYRKGGSAAGHVSEPYVSAPFSHGHGTARPVQSRAGAG